MEFSNQKRTKQIRRLFNLTGIVIAAICLVLLWMKQDIAVIITAFVFIIYVGIAQFANLCYVSFSTENGKGQIRYYPVISFFKKNYETIEFPHQSLLNFQIEHSMGFSDLTIAIRTQRGIAEYPSVSLAALSKVDIDRIKIELMRIIEINRR
jgi:hypothetical protein